MYRYGHPGESGTGEAPALREPKRRTKAKTPEDFFKARSGCRRRNSPPVQLWSASARMKRAKKSREKSRAMPKKLFQKRCFFVILRCSFPLFCSLPSAPEDPSTPELWHSKIFLSRDAPFANENKMETKCKKAFGKGRSKRERAGIKSGERHFTRKIQTAFCPRRRLFPRPPFC